MSTAQDDIREVRNRRAVLLETRKRDGTWVGAPVSLASIDGRTYFRTYDAAGKAKRLRNFPEVRVTPSSFFGKPKGTTVKGHARRLEGEEAALARRTLGAAFPVLHGVLVPLTHRLKGWTTLHYELDIDG